MLEPKLNADGTLDLGTGNESVSLTAPELDMLLERLALLRSQMKEKVPEVPPAIQGVVCNPAYMVRTDNQTKASLLRIRHAGFGWLNFEIPSHEIINMKKMWKAIADKLDLESYSDFYEAERQQTDKPH
ncbi:hypothetical protein Q8A64_08895 [Oxalobacteraceae bacterium R-40]|uniref:Uncharacterized protein n=1 Tax=Keguizhuia sedimenti TaxID=3064264 RepID=A0ABU1BNI1_9BURK|nr:hypothetical protein [Oxalobacteraceae bacterium R-40]